MRRLIGSTLALALLSAKGLAVHVEIGSAAGAVDPRFVSFVIDPASLMMDPPGVYSKYPYPCDMTNELLIKYAAALSPAYFHVNGGNSNCITYDGFDIKTAQHRPATSQEPRYLSEYCRDHDYYGSMTPLLFSQILEFSVAVKADFVWHLNMVFGRGYTNETGGEYVPWNASLAAGLIQAAAEYSKPIAGAILFEEVKESKLGFIPTSENLASDLAILKNTLGAATKDGHPPLLFGVLNQDSDQDLSETDAAYGASAAAVDVVEFSFYGNNAQDGGPVDCPYNPTETATLITSSAFRATLDANAQHYVRLSGDLGKGPPHLVAAAPCTHAPEGTGWGAVNAHAGLLWYADALGRSAAAGVAVFSRQTLFGGDYGLLDNSTYLPVPGYWVAVLHTRMFGPTVLSVAASSIMGSKEMSQGGDDNDDVVAYGHCAVGSEAEEGDVALAMVNFDSVAMDVELPEHASRTAWVLEGSDRDAPLLSLETLLNGEPVDKSDSSGDGGLPPLPGHPSSGAEPLRLPPHSAAYILLRGTAAGAAACS